MTRSSRDRSSIPLATVFAPRKAQVNGTGFSAAGHSNALSAAAV